MVSPPIPGTAVAAAAIPESWQRGWLFDGQLSSVGRNNRWRGPTGRVHLEPKGESAVDSGAMVSRIIQAVRMMSQPRRGPMQPGLLVGFRGRGGAGVAAVIFSRPGYSCRWQPLKRERSSISLRARGVAGWSSVHQRTHSDERSRLIPVTTIGMMDALGANRLPAFFLLPGSLTMGLDARWQRGRRWPSVSLRKVPDTRACSVLSVATAPARTATGSLEETVDVVHPEPPRAVER